ncbi:Peptidase family M23 [Lachnospiraceae bacterium]|nr:Peptidase family M23 [Lachnospiraceae bacterium]
MKDPNNRKKLRRLTVLVIPEGSANVREFRTSRDFLTAAAVLFFAAVILALSYLIYVAGEVSDERNQILALSAQLENVTSGNIILQAQNETLQQELSSLNAQLDNRNYVEQQSSSAEALNYIPSGLPMAGQISTPSEYSSEKEYVTFSVGDGTKIVAAANGTVKNVRADSDYGYVVEVDHGNDYVSYYGYPTDPLVSKGTSVLRGTTLFSGTGNASTLVYRVTYQGKSIDPSTIMKIDG